MCLELSVIGATVSASAGGPAACARAPAVPEGARTWHATRAATASVAPAAGAPRRPGAATVASGSGGGGAAVSAFPDPPTDPASLTPRQRKVLEVIRDWVERFGYPPSVREIGDAVGLTSTSSVHHQLRTLERKGYLRRDPHRTRAVDVRGPDDPAGHESTRRVARPPTSGDASAGPLPRRRSRPSYRCSATSPPVARSWPSRRWRACSRCRARSSARASCSCSTSAATRWSMRRSATATGWWCASSRCGERRDRGRDDRRRGHREDAAPPRRARVADAGEPRLRPHSGRRGHGARAGWWRCCAGCRPAWARPRPGATSSVRRPPGSAPCAPARRRSHRAGSGA